MGLIVNNCWHISLMFPESLVYKSAKHKSLTKLLISVLKFRQITIKECDKQQKATHIYQFSENLITFAI